MFLDSLEPGPYILNLDFHSIIHPKLVSVRLLAFPLLVYFAADASCNDGEKIKKTSIHARIRDVHSGTMDHFTAGAVLEGLSY